MFTLRLFRFGNLTSQSDDVACFDPMMTSGRSPTCIRGGLKEPTATVTTSGTLTVETVSSRDRGALFKRSLLHGPGTQTHLKHEQ
jgi:hypothetical protein